MARPFPYTHYACSCKDVTVPIVNPTDPIAGVDLDGGETKPFNPHAPYANYVLYPLENLLFCNECHELRCPRCYYEEVMYYFCPSCLFETQSISVKSESNRCTRSCFQCPVCVAPLSVSSLQATAAIGAMGDGPYILNCPHCLWSTMEIGITLEKSINISGQLNKIFNDAGNRALNDEASTPMSKPRLGNDNGDVLKPETSSSNDQYTSLVNFYKNQVIETTPSGPFELSHSFGLDSPSALSRLLNTYGMGALKKQKGKAPIMREVATTLEGLVTAPSEEEEQGIITSMANLGWSSTTSLTQRHAQSLSNPTATPMISSLRPLATPLRSKRAKRCRACRHQLVKPDDKRQSTRFKIRLLAQAYIPRLTVKPHNPNPLSFTLNLSALTPFTPAQFLLTVRNPLFDPIRITLATPAITPGATQTKVTILCPQFDVGANTDVWDEALDASAARRRTQDLSATMNALEGGSSSSSATKQAEAGKVWEKGRNHTTVIVEVVPGEVRTDGAEEDPALLEVPIHVRMEYETDADETGAEATVSRMTKDRRAAGEEKEREKKVSREMDWWVVLGLGRIKNA